MGISEKKMQIVINNYFKQECDVNTSIREAFEKGFRIGVKKGQSVQLERKKGMWIPQYDYCEKHAYNPSGLAAFWWCDQCEQAVEHPTNFCPNCGADMRGDS